MLNQSRRELNHPSCMTRRIAPKAKCFVAALADHIVHREFKDFQPLQVSQDVLATSQKRRCSLVLDARIKLKSKPATSPNQSFALSVGLFRIIENLRLEGLDGIKELFLVKDHANHGVIFS